MKGLETSQELVTVWDGFVKSFHGLKVYLNHRYMYINILPCVQYASPNLKFYMYHPLISWWRVNHTLLGWNFFFSGVFSCIYVIQILYLSCVVNDAWFVNSDSIGWPNTSLFFEGTCFVIHTLYYVTATVSQFKF